VPVCPVDRQSQMKCDSNDHNSCKELPPEDACPKAHCRRRTILRISRASRSKGWAPRGRQWRAGLLMFVATTIVRSGKQHDRSGHGREGVGRRQGRAGRIPNEGARWGPRGTVVPEGGVARRRSLCMSYRRPLRGAGRRPCLEAFVAAYVPAFVEGLYNHVHIIIYIYNIYGEVMSTLHTCAHTLWRVLHSI